jgi:hypothetical protein
LERYWPMHDGDSKYYTSQWGSGSLNFSSSGDGFTMGLYRHVLVEFHWLG